MHDTSDSTINVGIHAMAFYCPPCYVQQSDLEVYDGVTRGKYTVGLAQESMVVCQEHEDVVSMALTVAERLLSTLPDRSQIKRIEVGSESGLDRAKSIKSHLVSLLGHDQVDGADHLAACYGGTAALFTACHWALIAPSDQYALVVATDVAVYAAGPARPTGGAGAVAMLIGRNAPIAVDVHHSHVHATDHWDFYKPNPKDEYPLVDGALSIECYLNSLSQCIMLDTDAEVSYDAWCLHTPYSKLVMKAHARLTDVSFAEAFEPSLRIAKQVGNMYCASLYACLISCLIHHPNAKRIAMFSYGSGCVSRLFGISLVDPVRVDHIRQQLMSYPLAGRWQISAEEYALLMAERELAYGRTGPWTPRSDLPKEHGVFYLIAIDDRNRRHYQQHQ